MTKRDKEQPVWRAALKGIILPIFIALAVPASMVFFSEEPHDFYQYKAALGVAIGLIALLIFLYWDIKSFFKPKDTEQD